MKTPEIPLLTDNLSAVEIALDSAESANGKEIALGEKEYLILTANGGFSGNDQQKAFLDGQSQVAIDYKDDADPIVKLIGKVNLRLPQALEKLELADLALGATVSNEEIGLKIVERCRDYIQLEVTGGRDRIIALQARNNKGEIISNSGADLAETDDKWQARVGYSGKPEKVEVIYATSQQVKAYPFAFSF